MNVIGVEESSVYRCHIYSVVVHDLKARRLLFATPGRDHSMLEAFKQDLVAHQDDHLKSEHVCIDMSTAFMGGVRRAVPVAVAFARTDRKMLEDVMWGMRKNPSG